MEQYNEKIGTRKDLVSYRIETAKSDLKSAKILLMQVNIKAQITEPIMQFFMR